MFAFGANNILSAVLIFLSPGPPTAPKIDLSSVFNINPVVSLTSSPVVVPAPRITLECKPYNAGFPRFIDPLTVTVRDLNKYLSNNTITSELLVTEYLSRIQHLDRSSPVDPDSAYPLNSVIETIPLSIVFPIARRLDDLRKNGTILSHLHGIPILVKDNIATEIELGMNTTAGSLALLPGNAGTVPSDADVVHKLRKMGAVIIGKANMSEWAGARGDNSTSKSNEEEQHSKRPDRREMKKFPEYINGWSARGGQTYSAYVPHGNPSGSSSGSAIAVAAGFAPVSLGTDTDGSITGPASKAALYAIKPTVGLVSRKGIVPWSRSQDTAGVMAKSAWDVAAVLDAIVLNVDDDDDVDYEEDDEDWEEVECLRWLKSHEGNKRESYVKSAVSGESNGFKGIGIGVMNPEFWISDLFTGGRGDEALDTLKTLESLGARVNFDSISVPSIPELISTSNGNESLVLKFERKRDIEAYLSTLVWPPKASPTDNRSSGNHFQDKRKSPLRTLQSIVTFNAEHSKTEVASVHCCQEGFIDSLNITTSSNSTFSSPEPIASNNTSPSEYEKYQAALYWNRHYGRTIGLDTVFDSNPGIDALAIPSDGASSILPSLSGYPIATVPLGVDIKTGEPFGLSFIGRRFSEGVLLKIMAAYEEMMKDKGGRRVPKNMC